MYKTRSAGVPTQTKECGPNSAYFYQKKKSAFSLKITKNQDFLVSWLVAFNTDWKTPSRYLRKQIKVKKLQTPPNIKQFHWAGVSRN